MIDSSLITFITAGDPTTQDTLSFLKAMDEHADIIELGIPSTDPMADGPTIQKADHRALKGGFKIDEIFEIVREFRKDSNTPIILMTYYNVIYVKGMNRFITEARESGVDGMITVDLPIDEADEYLSVCSENRIKPIFLVAPNTEDERLKKIDEASGFVYLVSTLGTTGARDDISKMTYEALDRVKSVCEKPVAVGFGVSKPDHVKALTEAGADGVVVGSSIVKLIEKYGDQAADKIERKVRKLKEPLLDDTLFN